MTEAKEAQNVGADGMWPLPVVIAAGGKGTRLRPFTNSIPKELVEVNGTPIIDRIIAQFRARGCEEFWATMDYHAEKLEEHFENVDPGHQVRLVNANGHRGTAAPLKVLQGLVDPPFVLSNCDVLVDADYPAIAREGAENGDALTLESGAVSMLVLELAWNGACFPCFNIADRRINRHHHSIRFRRCCEQNACFRQRQPRFRQSQLQS